LSDIDVTIGIDIGGTNTRLGLVDAAGHDLATTRFPTVAPNGVDGYVHRLALAVEELCGGLPSGCRLTGIGIASPAVDQLEGTIHRPANLKWGTINIVEMLGKYFDLPITAVNDGNAAALGELQYGAARGMKNFIVLTLGTGLGAGIVMRGQLLEGEAGTAGELGHMTLVPHGRECGCGRRGCAETYVSATGICRTAFELLAQCTTMSQVRSITFADLTSKKLFELALGGDVIACNAFEQTGAHLGLMLSNVVAVFDPQAIFLSGGLANAGDLLLEPTERAFTSNVLEVYKQRVKILLSELPDGRAAVLGASWLVRSSLQNHAVT
jgi:glucokinase